jgi:hypothetical protein
MNLPQVRPRRIQAMAQAEQDIEAHLRNLRRKLERAAARGLSRGPLEARIQSEEAVLERMRRYRLNRETQGGEAI